MIGHRVVANLDHSCLCCRTRWYRIPSTSYTLSHKVLCEIEVPDRQSGVHSKVAQALLRHSTHKTTMEIYDTAVEQEQRVAHAGLVRSLLGEVGVPDGI